LAFEKHNPHPFSSKSMISPINPAVMKIKTGLLNEKTFLWIPADD